MTRKPSFNTVTSFTTSSPVQIKFENSIANECQTFLTRIIMLFTNVHSYYTAMLSIGLILSRKTYSLVFKKRHFIIHNNFSRCHTHIATLACHCFSIYKAPKVYIGCLHIVQLLKPGRQLHVSVLSVSSLWVLKQLEIDWFQPVTMLLQFSESRQCVRK